MPRIITSQTHRVGLPPGSLVFHGEQRVETPTITVIDYDPQSVRETRVADVAECTQYIRRESVTWINITGLHDTSLMGQFGPVFGLHPLVLEDILNTAQRPKFEDHKDYLVCIVKMLYRGPHNGEIVSEQVSMVLGQGFLITFQEVEGDVFDLLRERIRGGGGRVRTMGVDYLAYALLDAIVDNYFVVLEDIGDSVEQVQDLVVRSPEPATLHSIHRLKREMLFLRKGLWPMRELVSALAKCENPLIGHALAPYLRDVYEHAFQVIDTVELMREMLSGSLDTYMSSVSNRMNEVMKVLTVIATIFIPLTFIAGVYGMNFDRMPELKWRFGYPAAWLLMLLVAAGMGVYFKRRKWL